MRFGGLKFFSGNQVIRGVEVKLISKTTVGPFLKTELVDQLSGDLKEQASRFEIAKLTVLNSITVLGKIDKAY
jgi:hypothetical protein